MHALEPAIAGTGGAIVVIATVMMRARYGEVLGISPATTGPAEDVVNLAFIGRPVASARRANGVFGSGHHKLLPRCPAPHPVQVHRPLHGMKKGDKPLLCHRALGQNRATYLRAVSHGDRHVLIALRNNAQLIQWDYHVGAHGGGGGAGMEEGGDIGKRACLVMQLREETGAPRNRQRPWLTRGAAA